MPLRRGSQPDGRAARTPVVLARHALSRSAADAFSITAFRRATACSARGCQTSPGRRAPLGAVAATTPRRFRCSTWRPLGTRSRSRCRSGFRSNRSRTTRSKTCEPRNVAFARLNRRDTGLSRWKQVADLWCACWLAPGGARIPPAAFNALTDAILSGTRRAAACRRRSLSGSGARGGPCAASVPLGARVPGSVLRPGRPPSRERRFRRRHRQPAVGHDPRGCRLRRRARAIAGARSRRYSASRTTQASTPRSPTATPIATSSSPSVRWRSRAGEAASAWCYRPGWRPITAARRCGAGCSRRATWTPSSRSTTSAASFLFIAASGFCS